jgi:DNA recombination protein RmuC
MGIAVTVLVLVTALLIAAIFALWRLYQQSLTRIDQTAHVLEAERQRSDARLTTIQRYELTLASIHGRGELGEQVLTETARALGLREGLHFDLQANLAGGGTIRPDLVLNVGGGRQVPVDAKASLAVWAEGMETNDPSERTQALHAHVRNIRSRANELAGKNYQQWADAIYGTVMFLPSDAAAASALDTDPELLRWLLNKRIFLCGPTGFAVLASAAMFAATDRVLAEDVELIRKQALKAQQYATTSLDQANVASTHLQRFVAARAKELEALEKFRAAIEPLSSAAGNTKPIPELRTQDGVISL